MKIRPLRCLFLSSALLLSPFMQVQADTADKTIALSNNYAGNSWRQNMLGSWKQTTDDAVKKGVIASADAFTTGENQATEQAAQIQNLILQGYSAIVINAASPTALNGAVKQACDAGIIVVSFDGIVTEPCAYRISMDFKKAVLTRWIIWPNASQMAQTYWRFAGWQASRWMSRSIPGSLRARKSIPT